MTPLKPCSHASLLFACVLLLITYSAHRKVGQSIGFVHIEFAVEQMVVHLLGLPDPLGGFSWNCTKTNCIDHGIILKNIHNRIKNISVHCKNSIHVCFNSVIPTVCIDQLQNL